jgi:hypothetical protein
MQKMIGLAAGRVAWAGTGTSKGGKTFAQYRLELAPREYNGKQYRQRVQVADYVMRETFQVGDYVSCAGEVEAQLEDGRDGKSWPKLMLTGRVNRMETPTAAAEGATNEPA